MSYLSGDAAGAQDYQVWSWTVLPGVHLEAPEGRGFGEVSVVLPHYA